MSAALEGAVVVMIHATTPLDFAFCRNRVAALTAHSEIEKLEVFRSSLFAGLSIGDKCALDLVKSFFEIIGL